MNAINNTKEQTYLERGTCMSIRSVYKTSIKSKTSFKHIVAASVFALSLLQTSSVLAKDIPGSSQTSYGVSSNGAFQFQIPIVIPQGRNGVQPNLSLSFSSAGGSGMAGIGWGVSGLGAITRCGKTIATNGVRGGVQHSTNDRFCLNGQQLILVSGSYGEAGSEYRTEIDQFARIKAIGNGSVNVNGGTAPSRWKVWNKNGSIHHYGRGATAAFKLPGTDSIHRWNLAMVSDRNLNHYDIQYHDDGLPKQIDYTYNSGLTANQQIIYNYQARPDVRKSYFLGSQIINDKRLESIVVKNNNVVVREYRMAYQDSVYQAIGNVFNGSGATGPSRLDSVTEYGMNGTAMPPINIRWQAQTAGYVAGTEAGEKAPDSLIEYYTFIRNLGGGETEANSVKQINRGQWVDVNGDGETDLILSAIMPDDSLLAKAYIKVNGSWEEQANWQLPEPLRNYSDAITNGTTGRFTSGVVNQGQFADVNGDGLVDVVYSYDLFTDNAQTETRVTHQKTYINTGSGWQESAAYAPKDILFDYVSNGGIENVHVETVRGSLLDINGDGLVDWVTAYYDYISDGNGVEHKTTWLNNGTTWVRDTAYDMPDVFSEYRGPYSINHGQFVDVNGDGLVDWVKAYEASLETAQQRTYLNTGTGWDLQTPDIYNLPDTIFSNIDGWNDVAPLTRGRFVDVNGDGLADWVRSYETIGGATGAKTWLNTGMGWLPDAGYTPPFHYANNRYSDFDRGWPLNVRGQHIDLNRDGLVDYVESYKSSATGFPESKEAWLNTGTGWQIQPEDSPYKPTDLYFDYSGRENSKSQFGQYLDINSDGASDWVATREGITLSSKLTITPRVNLIESITTTMGVKITPSFLALTDNDTLYTQYPGADPHGQAQANICPLPGGGWGACGDIEGNYASSTPNEFYIRGASYVTASVTVPTPDPSINSVTSYQYAGAKISRLRGYLGFKRFTTTNSLTGISSTSEFSQTFPYVGMTAASTTLLAGEKLARSESEFDVQTNNRMEGIDTYFRFVKSNTTQQSELAANSSGNARYRVTTVDNIIYDDYGNIEAQRTRINDGGNILLHTTNVINEYEAKDEANWLVDLLKRTTQINQTAGFDPISNVSEFNYYSNDKGQLKQVLREPNADDLSVRLTTTFSYDSYGNVKTQTTQAEDDPRVPVDTISYDANQRLSTTLTNALNKSSIIEYHPQCDQPAKVTNPNGLAVEYTYDEFCRQDSVISPETLKTVTTYSVVDESCPENDCQRGVKFKLTTETLAIDEPAITQYFSAFNQPLLTTTSGFNLEPIRQQNVYDAQGRVISSSQPYFVGDTKHLTEIEYDVLGRQITTILPYNGENGGRAEEYYSYANVAGSLERDVTDAKLRTTKTRVNAIGQVTQVIDDDNNTLSYQYDSHGNLIKTTDILGNNMHLKYDRLGRRVELNDPDLGLSTYSYNGFYELVSQTDAKLQTISMKYDLLGRLKERTVPGDVSVGGGISTWEYDQAARGASETWFGAVSKVKGLRNQLADFANYQRTFEYDSLGRPSNETTTIEGISFNEKYEYDNAGRLFKRFYPNSSLDQNNSATQFGVKYGYQNGYLTSIMSTANAQGLCIEHWRADSYDALGRVELETVGRLVSTQRDFKPGQNVLERINSVTLRAGAETTVQNLTYSYDAVNNLMSRADLLNDVTETFWYDNLDRLTTHNKGGALVTSVVYDQIGNITHKSDVGNYHYNPSGTNSIRPHAVKGITGSAASADLTKFNVNWEYDGQEYIRSLPTARQSLLETEGQPAPFEYDANGNATKSGNRSIAWTAFDKPQRMAAALGSNGTSSVSVYQYGPEQQRIIKKEMTLSALHSPIDFQNTTMYIGKYYERISERNPAGVDKVTHRYMVPTGGTIIQIERDEGTSFDQPKYLLADNLGSTHVILNSLAEVEQTLAFDPWGMRMNVGDSAAVNSVTNRGYTGHEMDDEVGLINMNARVYDPYLGRFLSADPVLPDAGDMQAFNRYSYVINNPLKYTDPTGNSFCIVASSCEPPPLPSSGGGFTICGGVSGGGIFAGGCNGPVSPFKGGHSAAGGGGMNTVLYLAYQGVFAQDDYGIALYFTDLRGMENAIRNAAAAEQTPAEGAASFGLAPTAIDPSTGEDRGEFTPVKGNIFLGAFQYGVRENTIGVIFGERGKLRASDQTSANIEAFESIVEGTPFEAVVFVIGIRKNIAEAAAKKLSKKVTESVEKIHGHHSFPKAIGGHPKQTLSNIVESMHTGKGGIHSDLASFEGGWLRPKRGMKGSQIVDKFGQDGVIEGLRRFYSQDKWKHLAKDFENAVDFTQKMKK